MRTPHKAAALEQQRADQARELVLQHHNGADVLAACNGDAEHALRILDAIKERQRPIGEVIRLPTTPILDFEDVLDEEAAKPALFLDPPVALVVAVIGLAAWAILAALAFGIFELVGWLR